MKPNTIKATLLGVPSKRRSTFAILFYINRTKIRNDGLCQVLCKVSIDADAEQIGTKVAVDPSLWNPATGRAEGRSRNAIAVNRALDCLTEQIEVHYKEIRMSLGTVTAGLVKNALLGVAQKPQTLMGLFEEHNEEFCKRVGVDRGRAVYQVYLLSYKHLLSFLHNKYDTDDVPLRSLDLSFIDAYDLYLCKDLGMGQKTIHQHLYNLKKISRRAVGQGTLRRDPFHTVHPALPPLRSRHLKLAELKKVMESLLEDPRLERMRDWFVFSTFTGLAYVDLKRLSTEHLWQDKDGIWWIHIKRQKTGTDSTVRVLDIPLQIIGKYRAERKSDCIFNMYTYGQVRYLMSKLGKHCGIEKLTFHQARHNFGTHVTLSQGVPIETVSRMMGHKSITTTQIYAKVTDKKVEEDMKRLKLQMSDRTEVLYADKTLRCSLFHPRAE